MAIYKTFVNQGKHNLHKKFHINAPHYETMHQSYKK